jgi:hypothetical protein
MVLGAPMKRFSLGIALSLLLPGCGLVKINTNIPDLAGGGSSEGSSGGAPIGAPYDEDELGNAVLATFKAWDYNSCKDFDCTKIFKEKAGVTEYKDAATYVYAFNPRRTLKNPDPTWLTGWEQMTGDEHANKADETYQALAVAAMRKTWVARCHADYAAIDRELRANDAKWTFEIDEASKIAEPYGRIGALLGLVEKARQESASAQSYIDRLRTDVGYPHPLRIALKNAYESTGRDYLFAIQDDAPRDDKARPRLAAAVERDMYCYRAMRSGTPKTPALTSGAGRSSYTERGAKYVKAIFSEEEAEKLDRLAQEEARKAADAVRPGKFSNVGVHAIAKGEDSIANHPKLGHMPAFGEIKKISAEGGKQIVEITERFEQEYPYDCVDTNKIDRIAPDGRIIYRSICKFGKDIRDLTVKITLGEMPKGVSIEIGDKIEGYALVQKHEEKTLTQTKSLVKRTELWVLDLHHLDSLSRKGKNVGKWF